MCGYHGLEMGCDGKTTAMPGQRVRGFPAIKSYPVEERHGFIWIWPGDPAKADAALSRRCPGTTTRIGLTGAACTTSRPTID